MLSALLSNPNRSEPRGPALINNIVREDVQHARFDFDRDAFVIPTATTDDDLLDVIGEVTEDVLAAYTAITRAMPEEFRKLAEDLQRGKIAARLNGRPRQTLGFMTPSQVLEQALH